MTTIDLKGQLHIDFKGSTAELTAQGDRVTVRFPSLMALHHFHRFFLKLRAGKSAFQHPVASLFHKLYITYQVEDIIVAEMGPTITPTWWGRYFDLEFIHLYPKKLLKVAVNGIIGRS